MPLTRRYDCEQRIRDALAATSDITLTILETFSLNPHLRRASLPLASWLANVVAAEQQRRDGDDAEHILLGLDRWSLPDLVAGLGGAFCVLEGATTGTLEGLAMEILRAFVLDLHVQLDAPALN